MDIDAFLTEVLSSNEDWHVTTKDAVSIIDPIIQKDISFFEKEENYPESGYYESH